ncbi:unnamed protein product [Plutella xylostella]|uniref:ubiquitinyl hydrolase 1 n=1 Tax=Plutella xylostella TaxID=51655 RepID=A0A8S4DTT7_PLUXY|nr:unnamed protein product [Plutella xylostella]
MLVRSRAAPLRQRHLIPKTWGCCRRCGAAAASPRWPWTGTPTALHLRYQTTREKAYIEHSSVRSVAAEAARPIDLDHCLSAFTAEEPWGSATTAPGLRPFSTPETLLSKACIGVAAPNIVSPYYAYIEHSSVRSVAAEAARPIDLDHCLSAFTAEERLEQPYHCDGCRSAQPATKKLQIWRLPPILIVHLKRFQYVNNKWIKSQKVVNFPFEDFDPTAYLASVPQETILRHKELLKRTSTFHEDPISESETDDEAERDGDKQENKENHVKPREKRQRDPVETRARKRLESSSLVTTPVMDDNLIDYHQHHLLKGQDPFDLKYRLYAVVSHSGQLSGGHYVAYARNPSGAWLCYNDSSCRELPAPHIDPATAYLLFYERQGLDPDSDINPATAYLLFFERQGLDPDRYLPDVTGKQPMSDPELLDPEDSDLKKMCSVM